MKSHFFKLNRLERQLRSTYVNYFNPMVNNITVTDVLYYRLYNNKVCT